jgi:acyl carrier protein
MDEQVKIRGYRIELGEIEAALTQHPLIQDAVVIAWDEVPGEKRLVGYVVVKGEPGPTGVELRSYIKERLPEYMVPWGFVRLPALPLTPNGKVDRQHLPKPEAGRPELEQAYTAPQTKVEEQLAAIWAEVLSVERVGIHDNFFELGGHSLLAARVVSKIRQIFAIELPVRQLFEDPTVSGLAGEMLKNERARIERTAELLCEISAMSDDAVAAMLQEPLERVRKEKAS